MEDRRKKAVAHRDLAERLKEHLSLDVVQARYSGTGNWYAHLKLFPAALFDANGYFIVNTEEEYLSSKYLKKGKQLSINTPGISAIPGYVRCSEKISEVLNSNEPLTFDYQKTNSQGNQYTTKATADDFLKAFSNQTLLNDQETTQLRLHFQQPAHVATPTFLGKLMGEESHQGASSRNVWMAKKISKFLGIEPPQREDGTARWWAYLVDAEKVGRYWQLQLKPEVVSALTQLGWIQESIVPEEELKAELQEEITKSLADSSENRTKRLELAPKKPKIVQVTRAEYRRNSDVVAEIMLRAAGNCEGCGCNAPFIRASNGTPYLEAHHILPLAEGGDDTVENAVALCPNCHRRKHFG